jgi:PAS domain-containing protein
MHAIMETGASIMAPLVAAASWISACFQLACRLPPIGFYTMATIVVASLALAIGCSAWAVIERTRSLQQRHDLLACLRRTRVALRFRDALIGSLPEGVVILRAGGGTSLSFRGAGRLLQSCLAGPEGASLARAINELVDGGKSFSLSVRTIGIRDVTVRGRRVGDSAAVFLVDDEAGAARQFAPDREVRESAARVREGESILTRSRSMRATAQILSSPGPGTGVHSAFDALSEGAVIVGPDGRLERHNAAFARQWSFRDDELRGRPRLTTIAARSSERLGADAIWDVVASGSAAADPARHGDWGPLVRGDGRPVSLAMSRLPDGGTMVIFQDRKRASVASPDVVPRNSLAAA